MGQITNSSKIDIFKAFSGFSKGKPRKKNSFFSKFSFFYEKGLSDKIPSKRTLEAKKN